jgi:YVTN family beta-propeller protein
MKYIISSMVALMILLQSCTNKNSRWVAFAPADSLYCQINGDTMAVLPNGRIITPLGRQIRVAPHPYGLVVSPDGKTAVTANSGVGPFSITIIKNLQSGAPEIHQIPEGPMNDKGVLDAVFMGLAISHDSRKLYVAGGQADMVYTFSLETCKKTGEISCSGPGEDNHQPKGYLGDMVLSQSGNYLYVVDQINFCIDVIDTRKERLITRVRTGRYPFGIAISPDESQLFVANVGVFSYSLVTSADSSESVQPVLDYPAFGYMSKEMLTGIKNDSLDIRGLGDPNVFEAFSVWTYDLRNPENPEITAKVKTGFLVGQPVEGIPAVGGSSPNSLVANHAHVFVSNGTNDCISVISAQTHELVREIFLQPDKRLSNLRGIIPFGLALSPSGDRLFVAEAGINAIAVIDTRSLMVIGHIPVGWFPAKIDVTPDGKQLIVANAKGFGSGPNGGRGIHLPGRQGYIGLLMNGTVSIIYIPDDKSIEAMTSKVIRNNYHFEDQAQARRQRNRNNPVPLYAGERNTPIKYIVFISKENRTYDEVFGQLEKGKGDPSLARYGMHASFSNSSLKDSVVDATVMINHLNLANRFAIADNFYVDADVSADGHRWLSCVYPNEWVETSTAAAYGGRRNMDIHSKAPGIFSFVGSSGSFFPEDYNEAGSMWEHFERNQVSFFNFGFAMEQSPGYEDSTMKYGGIRYLINYPVPDPVYKNSSHKYATFNMAIPDQFRADVFIGEFNEKWIGQGKAMPQVITIMLPNDHGADERPHAGFPYRESYMCDNDLALGRIVEFLSHTPYWKNMAIIVTEDDAQDGRDHIDAHRSLLMVISPYARKDYVSHKHYSFGSIFKTIWNLLGIPYLNQYDATASDLADFFTDNPDFTPYNALPVDPEIFDPKKALTPINENFDWKAVIESPKLDDVKDFLK